MGDSLNGSPSVIDSHPASGRSLTLSPEVANDPSATPRRTLQAQHSVISESFRRLFPELHRKIRRTVTMPRTATLLPADTAHSSQARHGAVRFVPYLSFPTIVGKNSAFHGLTEDQLEEIGGIVFRALNMLMWAVPLVCPCTLVAFHHILVFASTTFLRWRYPLLL
jgi:hypothetical protein